MKTLQDLTPEIEAKIPAYIARALDGVSDGGRYREFDIEKAIECVAWNYKQCDLAVPRVLVAENPLEMTMLFNTEKHRLSGSKDPITNKELYESHSQYLFTMNFYSDCLYNWYEFIRKEFDLPLTINDDFQECFRLQRASGISQAIFSDDLCVVCKYPKQVFWNDNDQMHNPAGNAVVWGYDHTPFDCYYINGREVPAELFKDGFTKEQFIRETNEDIRGAMYEIIEAKGEGSMLEFLGAKEYAKQTTVHASGEIEELTLYRTTETFPELESLSGQKNVPLCWLKLVCPSTGQVYLISTDASFETPIEAAKYHRPEGVPLDLDYRWDSRS
jgi:hypothetical protein